jgi:2-isopropylmalate synthase
VGRLVERVKQLEARGWSFEAADASFELMLRDEVGQGPNGVYSLESWRTAVEQRADGCVVCEATIKVQVGGRRVISTAEGNGPVNALDNALREALLPTYPDLAQMELVDYKVRILEGIKGTGAVTRVLISSTDGTREWQTVGVHENVIEASLMDRGGGWVVAGAGRCAVRAGPLWPRRPSRLPWTDHAHSPFRP